MLIFTSILGTHDSQLARILLGGLPSPSGSDTGSAGDVNPTDTAAIAETATTDLSHADASLSTDQAIAVAVFLVTASPMSLIGLPGNVGTAKVLTSNKPTPAASAVRDIDLPLDGIRSTINLIGKVGTAVTLTGKMDLTVSASAASIALKATITNPASSASSVTNLTLPGNVRTQFPIHANL